ncbi:MAG: hypothetical protein ACOYMS_15690, partial [Terrimicrobiaceae bacterium]
MKLSELFPQTGGQIFNSTPISRLPESNISKQFESQLATTSNQLLQSPLPVFVLTLLPDAASYCCSLAKGDQRSCLLFAPKVTVFDGLTAMISDERSRPFVTGFRSTHPGLEPEITTWQDGIQLRMTAHAISDKVHLNVAGRFSNILNVRTRTFRYESGEFQLQIPEQQESVFQSTTILNDGDTLVLVPLERNSQGLLTLLLITPRIIKQEPFESLLSIP